MNPFDKEHAAMNAAAAGPGVTHSGARPRILWPFRKLPRHHFLRLAGILAAGLLCHLPTSADDLAPRELPRTIAHDFRTLVTTKENLLFAAAGAGAAWAGSSFDDRIVESRFNSEVREETTLDHIFEPGYHVGGGAVQIGGACATYGLGMLMHNSQAQALGADLIRAQFVSGCITLALKKAAGRERPDRSSETSFPSGHASGTFATATVLYRRHGPRAGIPALFLASYVAGSRLNESQHYLSDVIAGAALGFIVGHTITRDHEQGRLGVYPTLSPHGAGIRFVFRPVARAPSSVADVAALR